MRHVPTPGRVQLPLSKIKRRTISCIRNFVGKDSIRSLLHALEEEEERSFSVGDSYEFMRGHDHPHAQVREARKVTRGTTSGRMILLREETGRAHLFARGNSFTQRFARPGLSRRTTLSPRSLLIYSVHLGLLSRRRKGGGGRETHECLFLLKMVFWRNHPRNDFPFRVFAPRPPLKRREKRGEKRRRKKERKTLLFVRIIRFARRSLLDRRVEDRWKGSLERVCCLEGRGLPLSRVGNRTPTRTGSS